MTKAKISEYDAVASNNTDVNGVNIAEGCPPSGMNNMGREIMAALKRFQVGSDGDGVTVGGNLVVSGSSTLSTTSISSADINAGTIDGTAIGGSTPAAGSFTTLNTSGQVVFNDAGADVDFRVEGDTDANLLFVDAGNDRVGIGTSSPQTTFTIASDTSTVDVQFLRIYRGGSSGQYAQFSSSGGAAVVNSQNGAGGAIIFSGDGGAERARFDGSGNLLVGTTSNYGGRRLDLRGDNNSFVASLTNSNADPFGLQIYYSTFGGNNTANEFLQCQDSGANRMTVRSNGGIANYSANDVNLSDRREKTNFAPAKNYLDTICAIPVQTFNYVDQNLEEDDGLTLGVVAQDVQEVAPELVMESNWGTQEEPKMRLSIYQTDLQYALMKCIQELKAELDEAKARIAALENA